MKRLLILSAVLLTMLACGKKGAPKPIQNSQIQFVIPPDHGSTFSTQRDNHLP